MPLDEDAKAKAIEAIKSSGVINTDMSIQDLLDVAQNLQNAAGLDTQHFDLLVTHTFALVHGD